MIFFLLNTYEPELFERSSISQITFSHKKSLFELFDKKMRKRFQLTRQNAIDENSNEKESSNLQKKNSVKRQNAFDENRNENLTRKQITVIQAPSI